MMCNFRGNKETFKQKLFLRNIMLIKIKDKSLDSYIIYLPDIIEGKKNWKMLVKIPKTFLDGPVQISRHCSISSSLVHFNTKNIIIPFCIISNLNQNKMNEWWKIWTLELSKIISISVKSVKSKSGRSWCWCWNLPYHRWKVRGILWEWKGI